MDADLAKRELSPQDTTPLSLDELQERYADLDKEISSTLSVPASFERQTKKQEIIEDFIQKQIKEKDKYKHIFKTKNGSIYFMLATNESFRIKRNLDKWEPQYICNKMFFVDKQQEEKLTEMDKAYNFEKELMSGPLTTTILGIGTSPVEFGVISLPEIKFTETDNTIHIHGDKTGWFASGYHLGNPITEIIK